MILSYKLTVMLQETGYSGLGDLAQMLLSQYTTLGSLCKNADTHIETYLSNRSFINYVNHGRLLLKEVTGFVDERRAVFLPYITELAEKQETGHNCTHCSGRCDMRHTLRLLELTGTQQKLLNTADYIKQELLFLYDNEELKGSLRWLNNELTLIDSLLREVLTCEEQSLVPQIKEAHRKINAHS
jgi:hypothetical protein